MERYVIRLDVVYDADDDAVADKKCLEFCRAVAVVPGHVSNRWACTPSEEGFTDPNLEANLHYLMSLGE